jgi:hypothetical protein
MQHAASCRPELHIFLLGLVVLDLDADAHEASIERKKLQPSYGSLGNSAPQGEQAPDCEAIGTEDHVDRPLGDCD